MKTLTSSSRDAIAEIIQQIANEGKEGLAEGRSLDAALDAIESSIEFEDDGEKTNTIPHPRDWLPGPRVTKDSE